MPKGLSENQLDAMRSLGNYVGQTVDVITSQYDANVAKTFKPVAYVKSSTLRGLEARGLIRIVRAFWKGATVEVLRAELEAA